MYFMYVYTVKHLGTKIKKVYAHNGVIWLSGHASFIYSVESKWPNHFCARVPW